jgi:hypothetical protein
VGFDHRSRKDIFHLYKSVWNKRKPTLHIVGKGVDIRSSERQVLSIYSSAGRPTLTINGDTVATKNVGRAIYRTDTLMLKGENRLKVGVGEIADSMTLTIGNYLRRQ